ncbi:hypothetical protein DPMN_005969 [Dreissena polymorpha]|uniref:Uncharacterized protein n=1 Tax=Dreissena polymorpha TaxID=45954 RepID=A0A9D4MTP8_DREPO|nr:hypothetical protein DPMN_005969 [Dreissena polymorpha]
MFKEKVNSRTHRHTHTRGTQDHDISQRPFNCFIPPYPKHKNILVKYLHDWTKTIASGVFTSFINSNFEKECLRNLNTRVFTNQMWTDGNGQRPILKPHLRPILKLHLSNQVS